MKKLLCFLLLCYTASSYSQSSIPNGGFENWTSYPYLELDSFVTPTVEAIRYSGVSPNTRSTDHVSGNYSVRMETSILGTDTIFGFITAGEFGNSNGFPFSQSPDSIVGYYKSNIMPGDTALFIVSFSNSGLPFSFDVFPIVGTQNTWTQFSFPLSVALAPDSCFIAVASSNALSGVGIQAGSWLMLDSIAFAGSGITQSIPNFDFEHWTSDSLVFLDSWEASASVSRTSDRQVGDFALQLETIAQDGDTSFIVTNGEIVNGNIVGGHPFALTTDTLTGYYKYFPMGSDTAAMSLNYVKNGSVFDQTYKLLPAQGSYTGFDIPIQLLQAPDSMFVVISSSVNSITVGSTLYIDDLVLKSIVTSLEKRIDELGEVLVYPNPTSDVAKLSFNQLTKPMEVQVVDGLGRIYHEQTLSVGETSSEIDVSRLKSGAYFIRLNLNGEVIHRSMIKK